MRSVLKDKRGQLGNLQGIIITLVVIGIVLGVGFLVLTEFQTSMTEDSAAYNATGDVVTALEKVPTWLGVIVIIAVVGILLAILFRSLPQTREM